MHSIDAARRLILFTIVMATAGPLTAQVNWRPTPAPIATANNETWFTAGDPLTFDGSFYYPAGPQIFFDGNRMVRTGSYRGVPLYSDTTLEPYSKVFVPVAGGLMQPYERKRAGDLAGSTGSQAPSFPVSTSGEATTEEPAPTEAVQAPGPLVWNEPADLAHAREMTDAAAASQRAERRSAARTAVTPVSAAGRVPPQRDLLQLGRKPLGLNEIYINYRGTRWRSAGRAIVLTSDRFVQVGNYDRFAVYAETDDAQAPHRIYLPSRDNLIAPYERAGKATEAEKSEMRNKR